MIEVSIAGASGYAGGELLRLLPGHPEIRIKQATSERFTGRSVTKAHPNLRKTTALKFVSLEELEACDCLFLCLPHGIAQQKIRQFFRIAPRIIDLGGDFRLRDPEEYSHWYGHPHARPDLLDDFVYGVPELHRDEIRRARLVAKAGCNATATILALYPLARADWIDSAVVEVKVGSSEAGNRPSLAGHHPERSNAVRSFKPTGHRHAAEIIQELGVPIHFSATAIDLVRGVLATCHVFLKRDRTEKDVWHLYREAYGKEPFIRLVKERTGIYRYPEPKLLQGTNWCDIGFEKDPASNRLVVISAIDNLMKGAAGQAVQAFNLMCGFPEETALDFTGLHPV